jgi:hypothetical protein
MRNLWKWALFLALPTGLVVVAGEPADSVVPDTTTVQLLLLRQKSVQEELKIAPAVAKKVVEFTNLESEAYKKALKLGKEEKEKKIAELAKKNRTFLEDNLTAAQRTRLRQIALQVTGLQQLTRPEVAKLLDLTKEQQTTFREMHTKARKEMEEILTSKDREDRNRKLAKLREEVDKKIKAALTEKQRAKARELVGEPFKGKLELEGPE